MNECDELIMNITGKKNGLEIGGPSNTAYLIYQNAYSMDNVIFSNDTIWSKHINVYQYFPNKTGKLFVNDATNIKDIGNDSYDFIFASHVLEHIANPIKALQEWIRVAKNNGHIILVLPEKSQCFDHKRNVTEMSVLINQFERNVCEDDLTSLPEILRTHDLNLDPPAGTFEQFVRRSLDNFNNRCLHHFVYSPELLKKICEFMDCEFIYTQTFGLNIWFVMKIKK